MDGNRRFAKTLGLPAMTGHIKGYENAKTILKSALEMEVSHLTLWVLSKENLEKRSSDEISGILTLIAKFLDLKGEMIKHSIRFETVGDLSQLPKDTQTILKDLRQDTQNNTKLVLTIALVYSGQDEIIRAIRRASCELGDLSGLTQDQFRHYLDTSFLPPVDLIIRTGGDTRHSGFLLFDCAYSEYYFSPKFWPEFTTDDFKQAISSYQKAYRNFGK